MLFGQLTNEEISKVRPRRGKVLLAFTLEQERERLQRKGMVMVDTFDPNQYSIEEATVFATHRAQTRLNAGDRVIIDFSVYTAGLHQEKYKTAAGSRCLWRADLNDVEDDPDMLTSIYWAYDGTDQNTSEIFATVFASPEGRPTIIPMAGFVFIDAEGEGDSDDFVQVNGIWVPQQSRDSAPFFATVFASPCPEILPGDSIFCEAGMSAAVKLRWTSGFQVADLEYIRLPFILGKKDITNKFQLF